MEYDFLIIGQGLAGTALGFRLQEKGKSVLLLDLPQKNMSSRIAAGLYNPVTGKKMVKTWKGEVLFPELIRFYEHLEQVTGKSFLIKKPIYRPFLSIEEQNEWMGHSGDSQIGPFVNQIFTESQSPKLFDAVGGVLLNFSGWLNINEYLDGMSDYFGSNLKNEEFLENELIYKGGKWNYRDDQFSGVIYCNGLGAKDSKFFNFLPFAPVKGEILEVKQSFNPEMILNRGVFRVPLGKDVFRVGSTYTWHDLDQGPTESAKIELLDKLSHLVNEEVQEVLSHKHGIRPATKDRKPFLGKHPSQESVYIFNGFGAKGVSLVPYFSQEMVNFILENEPLSPEVDIARYFKYI